jgi:sulfofructose kinase
MSDLDSALDVICYGTISLDNVTYVPNLPIPRRDVVAISESNAVGGEALTVAVPLAAWGLKVAVIGNFIGSDWMGLFLMDELSRYPGIDTRYIRQHTTVATPLSRTLVTPDGERSRIVYWHDDPPRVELTKEIMAQGRLLSIDAYGRAERDRAAAVARSLGRPVIAADAIWPQYPLAGLSDVVIISRIWLQTNFPGAYEYDHALELQKLGAGIVVVTDGPRPVLVVRKDGSLFTVDSFPVEDLRDASGASSLFKAGMLYGWLHEGWGLETKVRFACAAAALSCQRRSPASPPPSLDDVLRLAETS